MNQKTTAIAAVLIAAALTGTLSTAPMIVYADESDTDTDQETNQENTGSGFSNNNNCAENLIQSDTSDDDCQFNNSVPATCSTSLISCASESELQSSPP